MGWAMVIVLRGKVVVCWCNYLIASILYNTPNTDHKIEEMLCCVGVHICIAVLVIICMKSGCGVVLLVQTGHGETDMLVTSFLMST